MLPDPSTVFPLPTSWEFMIMSAPSIVAIAMVFDPKPAKFVIISWLVVVAEAAIVAVY
jgi:asparagine N-glycosylation enzyme membrane subunit Stt3